MSHEFRTPLGSIRSIARLLLDRVDGPLTDEQEKQVSFIQHLGRRADRDGQRPARPGQGRGRPGHHLAGVVRDGRPVLGAARHVQADRRNATTCRWSSRSRRRARALHRRQEALADPAQLHLQRAEVHAAGRGARHGRAATTATASTFAVTDTGIGIAAEAPSARCSRTSSRSTRRSRSGCAAPGLGLSLSSKLARAARRRRRGRQRAGRGLDVLGDDPAELPGPDAATARRPPTAIRAAPMPTATATATILVVDDNPADALLDRAGPARGGLQRRSRRPPASEALEPRRRDGVDLIVLDVNLPDIDGFEVCRRLRAGRDTAHCPIIHLSATFVDDVDKVQGLDAGADGYLTHPVEPPVLIATVNAFLRARARRGGPAASEAKFKAVFDRRSTASRWSARTSSTSTSTRRCAGCSAATARGDRRQARSSAFMPGGRATGRSPRSAPRWTPSGAVARRAARAPRRRRRRRAEWSVSRALAAAASGSPSPPTSREQQAVEAERERLLDQRARGPRRGRARQPAQGRLPRRAVPRAPHAAQRDRRLVAQLLSAAPDGRGATSPRHRGHRAQRPRPDPAHRRPARRLAASRRASCDSTSSWFDSAPCSTPPSTRVPAGRRAQAASRSSVTLDPAVGDRVSGIRPLPAGGLEPAVDNAVKFSARRRPGQRLALRGRRRPWCDGARQRPGHRPRLPAARLRALPPGGRQHHRAGTAASAWAWRSSDSWSRRTTAPSPRTAPATATAPRSPSGCRACRQPAARPAVAVAAPAAAANAEPRRRPRPRRRGRLRRARS